MMKMAVVIGALAAMTAGCGKKDDGGGGGGGKKRDVMKTEAHLQLNRLMKNAKVYFVTNATYPIGKGGPLPDKPCCSYPDHKCPVTKAWAEDKIFAELDFQVDEPNVYQYSYESDGKTAKATATGDPECGGVPETFTLDLTSENGNPGFMMTEPPM